MNDQITKKDLVEILDQKFGSFKAELNADLDKRFVEERAITKEQFTNVVTIMNNGLESLQNSIDKNEGDHDRRISIVEDRVRVIKNVIEKDLNTKVAW